MNSPSSEEAVSRNIMEVFCPWSRRPRTSLLSVGLVRPLSELTELTKTAPTNPAKQKNFKKKIVFSGASERTS